MKTTVLLIFFLSLGILSAELEIDIPFDPNMIGPAHDTTGDYSFDSEWITITNIGSSTETYNLIWSYSDLPADWSITVCNDLYLCYIPNMPAPITLGTNESVMVHIEIGVNSTGGCGINITLNDGDLTEPISLDFTFNTEDNVTADEIIETSRIFARNFPNPFNPNTTIVFTLPAEISEITELKIFNIKGESIKSLPVTMTGIEGSAVWNGTDSDNKPVSSGIYYYQISSDDKLINNKMLLLK